MCGDTRTIKDCRLTKKTNLHGIIPVWITCARYVYIQVESWSWNASFTLTKGKFVQIMWLLWQWNILFFNVI